MGVRAIAIPFLTDVIALTGGGSTKLDGVATVAAQVPKLACFIEAASLALRIYELKSGTTAEASPGTIRPDDYAAVTNEKIWVSVL